MLDILLGSLTTIVILLLIGFLVKKVFDKFSFFSQKKGLKLFSIIFISVGIYLGVLYIIFSTLISTPKVSFDENLWKTQEELRYQMVDNIIQNKILIGKKKNEIEKMIGIPNKISDSGNKWSYEIIGRNWAEFTFITFNVNFENNLVNEVSALER